MLVSGHYKLRDLEIRVLQETFYVIRLKLALISTPPITVNTQCQFNKAAQGSENRHKYLQQ